MKVPRWKDMPDALSLATLSWEDVYIKACKEMQRNPSREETLYMFDEMSSSMKNAVQDDMPAQQLDALISEIVTECLKSKPYAPHTMSKEELISKKYCHECKEIQETYWELNFCEKNPEGTDVLVEDHGNDNTCKDEYCNPESIPVEKESVSESYIKEHAVYERCVKCHQYFDSAGPQAGQSNFEQCNNCNGTGIFDTCAECGGPGCVYCTIEEEDYDSISNILPTKDCSMCRGTGKFDSTQTLLLAEREITVGVKSVVGAKLTQDTKADIAEAFLNQNITEWEHNGEKIHDNYTLTVDANIAKAKTDEQYVIVSITSDGKNCRCMHAYGWKGIQ